MSQDPPTPEGSQKPASCHGSTTPPGSNVILFSFRWSSTTG